MKKFPTLMTLVMLAPILANCTPAPEEVCQHTFDLVVEGLQQRLLLQQERGGEVEAMPSEAELAKLQDTCIIDTAKAKEKDASAYKKKVSCVMAAEAIEDLEKCK